VNPIFLPRVTQRSRSEIIHRQGLTAFLQGALTCGVCAWERLTRRMMMLPRGEGGWSRGKWNGGERYVCNANEHRPG
jgi:hypothetical protein